MSQNGKDLQMQVTRMKQTIKKILDKDVERICALFLERGITIISKVTIFSMTITTIARAIAGVFGVGSVASGPSQPKDKGTLKKRLNSLTDALKTLTRKVSEAMTAIVGSVVSAMLIFLGKSFRFVNKQAWAVFLLQALLG